MSAVNPLPDENKKEATAYEYEQLLVATGGVGRYQLLVIIAYTLNVWLFTTIQLFMVFGAVTPTSTCTNGTAGVDVSNSTSVICTSIYPFYSLVVEFGISGSTAGSITSIQMAGTFIGSLMFSMVSDRFGRRRSLILILAFTIILLITRGCAVSWQMVAIVNFFLGGLAGGLLSVNYTYFIEMMLAKWRIIFAFVGWCPGCIVLGLYALGTKDWRVLTFSTLSFAIPPLLVLIFLQDSPKYHIARNDLTLAHEILAKIAAINGIRDFDKSDVLATLENVRNKTTTKTTYSYWHLFYSKKATLGNLAIVFTWMNTTIVFYGIVFGMQRLAGNLYVNFIISNLFGFIGSAVVTLLDIRFKWFTRRLVLLTSLSLQTACMIFNLIAYSTTLHITHPISVTVVAIIGLFLNQIAWVPAEIVIPEFYPTELRTMGYGLSMGLAKIVTIIAPKIIELSSLWLPGPFVVLAVFSLANTVYDFFGFPETKDADLPDLPTGEPFAWCNSGHSGEELDEHRIPARF